MSDQSNSNDAKDAKVEKEISYIGARLREKTTYAGLLVVVSFLLPFLAKYFPALGMANASDIVAAISSVGIGIGGLIAIALPEKTVTKVVLAFFAIGVSLTLLLGTASAAEKKPVFTGNVVNDIQSAVTQQASAVATKSDGTPTCDFNIFALLNTQNVIQTLQACGAKLLTDSQAALASANTANDNIATACLTPGVALIQAGIGTPAVPAVEAVPATATTPTIAAVPAVAAQLPGPVLIFQKFREFLNAGGITNCKAWVNNTVTAATASGL
jgi:hypothetical protein